MTLQRREVRCPNWSVPAVPLDTGNTVAQPVHLLPHGSRSAPTSTSGLRPHPSAAMATLQVQWEMASWFDSPLPQLERGTLGTDQTDTAPESVSEQTEQRRLGTRPAAQQETRPSPTAMPPSPSHPLTTRSWSAPLVASLSLNPERILISSKITSACPQPTWETTTEEPPPLVPPSGHT